MIEGLRRQNFAAKADLRSSAASSCENDCYMAEKSGDRIEMLCKGHCKAGTSSFVIGAASPPPAYICSGKA